jgi:hypothetical protein
MTTARQEIVDPTVTRWYHCISRCVRGGYLMGDGLENRKQWIESRLELLAANFSISIGGFAVLDNHLHVLMRLDPDVADRWTATEIVRRWITVYPPKSLDLDNEQVVANWIAQETKDGQRVETLRSRLKSLSWFMKSLKEPLSRLSNKQDGCRGTFWEKRFKSIAILDTEALLATSIYVDLNVFAAGLADIPELSPHTSVQQRVMHVGQQGKLDAMKAARQGSVAGSDAAGNVEQAHWLIPIQDRRAHTNAVPSSTREGMLETLSLGSYLLLVDYTSRLFRKGKARLNAGVKDVFDRLETSAEVWNDRIEKMLGCCELRGTFFAADDTKVREHASRCGKRRANLSPQLATAPAG